MFKSFYSLSLGYCAEMKVCVVLELATGHWIANELLVKWLLPLRNGVEGVVMEFLLDFSFYAGDNIL
jgi:hypothetical protein